MFDEETIKALATLRLVARTELGTAIYVQEAIETLDNAGVFAALDEQTDYAPAIEILAESAAKSLENEQVRGEQS